METHLDIPSLVFKALDAVVFQAGVICHGCMGGFAVVAPAFGIFLVKDEAPQLLFCCCCWRRRTGGEGRSTAQSEGRSYYTPSSLLYYIPQKSNLIQVVVIYCHNISQQISGRLQQIR